MPISIAFLYVSGWKTGSIKTTSTIDAKARATPIGVFAVTPPSTYCAVPPVGDGSSTGSNASGMEAEACNESIKMSRCRFADRGIRPDRLFDRLDCGVAFEFRKFRRNAVKEYRA